MQQILKAGVFGDCTAELVAYEANCHKVFPLATTFCPPSKNSPSQDPLEAEKSEQLSEQPPEDLKSDRNTEGDISEEIPGEK